MVYSLSYRRPSFVSYSRRSDSLSSSSSAWSANKPASEALSGYHAVGVPPGLSFDKIIAGKTCKPCTLRDFMNYLIYIEHSAENLQFFLWYRDYLSRFANLPNSEKSLSPLWLNDKPEVESPKSAKFINEKALEGDSSRPSSPDVAPGALPNFDMTLELDPEAEAEAEKNGGRKVLPNQWDTASSVAASTSNSSYNKRATTDFRQVAADAFESHNIVAPFTIQPYREEVTRIIATYLASGAPRELNLSSRERANVLRALASTTHPSALGRVAASVEATLRHQSHPNFVRHSIQNGGDARITFAVSLGLATTLLGLVFAILFTLSGIPRGYRAISAIFFLVGIATLILGTRGICVVLNVFHHCHLQPWELFDEEPDNDGEELLYGGTASTGTAATTGAGGAAAGTAGRTGGSVSKRSHDSFDSFGSANSWEDQPWISRYERLSVFRKIFNREVRVNEDALRQLHDTMLVQALLGSLLATAVLEAIFLSVPGGHLF